MEKQAYQISTFKEGMKTEARHVKRCDSQFHIFDKLPSSFGWKLNNFLLLDVFAYVDEQQVYLISFRSQKQLLWPIVFAEFCRLSVRPHNVVERI